MEGYGLTAITRCEFYLLMSFKRLSCLAWFQTSEVWNQAWRMFQISLVLCLLLMRSPPVEISTYRNRKWNRHVFDRCEKSKLLLATATITFVWTENCVGGWIGPTQTQCRIEYWSENKIAIQSDIQTMLPQPHHSHLGDSADYNSAQQPRITSPGSLIIQMSRLVSVPFGMRVIWQLGLIRICFNSFVFHSCNETASTH